MVKQRKHTPSSKKKKAPQTDEVVVAETEDAVLVKGTAEVLIEGMEGIQQYATTTMHSEASSLAPFRKTMRLKLLFPTSDTPRFGKIETTSVLHQILKHMCMLPDNFIQRLETIGFITPQIIGNRFGLSTKQIA